MIGVAVKKTDLDVAAEFFELFKVQWEPAVPGKRYRLILATSDEVENIDCDVLIIYGSRQCVLDREAGVEITQLSGPVNIDWGHLSIPVYNKVGVCVSNSRQGVLKAQGNPVECRYRIGGVCVWRIGYDLFDEIRHLLTNGQPASYALTSTLELHIEILRQLLIESNIPFVEILPRPAGYDFICCLTHDVDFFGIRRHRFDRTLAGFLYRSSIGSLIDLVRRRRSVAEVFRNWLAFCSLPLVYAGLLPDFWRPFEDYAKVEDKGTSTFFLIPYKGKPGLSSDGTRKAWRAAPYGISDVEEEVKKAAHRGIEIGLHGIDAWRDADAGREELRQLSSLTDQKATGIRMHWLYFDKATSRRLEEAGFDYDSTCGYNETVGYRAGTMQAFRPLGCATLMELPMSIMDSALFSTGRMNLGRKEAADLCRCILADARRFGGAVVINWHDRSLAPERLWGEFYKGLLKEVQREGRVWLATAGEAVQWFRWRRSIKFVAEENLPHVQVVVHGPSNPGGVVRVYQGGARDGGVRDLSLDGPCVLDIPA